MHDTTARAEARREPTRVGQVDNLQRFGNPLVEAGGGLYCAVDNRAQDFILPHITAHASPYYHSR
jgi:hypothetical protein